MNTSRKKYFKLLIVISFFRPFYGSYNIIELDPAYQNVLICGSDFNSLWILSRTPRMSPLETERLIKKARELGFDMSRLIMVEQMP